MRTNTSRSGNTFVVVAVALAILIAVAFLFLSPSQAPDPAPSAAPVQVLQPQTAPLQTASPAVPPADESAPTAAETARVPRPGPEDLILSPDLRDVPGLLPTRWIYFRDRNARQVEISGAWNSWNRRHPMHALGQGLWAYEIAATEAAFGRYPFKFIVDGQWEPGTNRILHINEEGLMERPPRIISQALIEDTHQIRFLMHDAELPEGTDGLVFEMTPDYGIAELRWVRPEHDPRITGYRLDGDQVVFVFDPQTYDLRPEEVRTVVVAGAFSDWNQLDDRFVLQRQADHTWTLSHPFGEIDGRVTDEHLFFKFVVNQQWMNPPVDAPNAQLEPGTPHLNLTLPRGAGGRPELWLRTETAIDLQQPPSIILRGLHERALLSRPSPGAILDTFFSEKPMGVTLDREAEQTVFRLFSPRAITVELGLFDGPYHTLQDGTRVEPATRHQMTRDEDGVWEYTLDGLRIGQYYAFRVDGPAGDAEGFNAARWLGDPYAFAVSLAEGNSIVVDLTETNDLWQGWSDAARSLRIPWEDMVIYETHVRHFTWDPSSNVDESLRGTYLGFLETEGQGTGLDHLRRLGVNVIQFMPIHEFPAGFVPRHDWGYATDFFFAPESSFALHPREGSQIHEFRHLVDQLKQRGFAVFLDVVYNHIGGVNVFEAIDRPYYFRLNPDFTLQNFSGVGNDVATERPMMRRLIVESVLFWVEEYGIDGFRFDLGELIDDETLLEIEREIRTRHPHVVLHSEPWSFRGNHKDFIGRTTWGAWNDEFREPAKRFVVGHGNPEQLQAAIRGSVTSWARHPLQSVNYMESHDDHSLVDELTLNPGRDGRELSARDERVHKLAATLIFTSLGTPMITEGQDWMRSKHGIRNTYNQGDELNALRWTDRERPHAREVSNYYAQMIRFRLSEAGRALRVRENPSMDYVRFLETGSHRALGWIVNANNERPGVPAVMVLMNTSEETVSFAVDMPPGLWGQVADGREVRAEGLPNTPLQVGSRRLTFEIPPQTAFVYRNGF